MKATVTKEFDGAPDGAIYPKTFLPGAIIEGDLARVAVREGWAVEGEPERGETGTTSTGNDTPTGLPKGWKKLNGPNMLALARRLGAGDDVQTKAQAFDFLTEKATADAADKA